MFIALLHVTYITLLWRWIRLILQVSHREPFISGFLTHSERTATQCHIHNGRGTAWRRLYSDIAVVAGVSSKYHTLEGVLQLSEVESGLGLTAPTA